MRKTLKTIAAALALTLTLSFGTSQSFAEEGKDRQCKKGEQRGKKRGRGNKADLIKKYDADGDGKLSEDERAAANEAKVKRVLREQGIEIQDVVYGDMTDADTVREALTGCDCVIHAAAAVEISSQRSVLDSNIAGNHNVLGSAVSLGLDPIVYVSSIATMFPPPGPEHTTDDPVVSLSTDYGR